MIFIFVVEYLCYFQLEWIIIKSKKDDEESDYVLQHVKEMLLIASKHVVVDEHENKIKMETLKQKVLREKVPF